MPKIILIGHEYIYPASDVLRMFFGNVTISGNELSAGKLDIPVIYSTFDGATVKTYTLGENGLPEKIFSDEFVSVRPKRELKRQLYLALSELTGIKFPWGSLTGIRPTLMAEECGFDRDKLNSIYFVDKAKADIAVMTALNEKSILSNIKSDSVHVFISLPFCPSRCEYCSFPTARFSDISDIAAEYIKTLLLEINIYSDLFGDRVSSIYLGGGTPTSLPDDLLNILLKGISSLIPSKRNIEFTVEAGRPETITMSNLLSMKNNKVTRICINPQTFNNSTLTAIGRNHNTEDVYRAINDARSLDFETISMDLIAGLSAEKFKEFKHSLDETISLFPDNITVHSLSLKRSSDLKKKLSAIENYEFNNRFTMTGGDIAEMLDYSYSALAGNGYKPYYMYRQKDTLGGHENIGYTRAGHECIYNVAMMSDKYTILGIGAKAMSKRICFLGDIIKTERFANPSEISGYIINSEEVFTKKREFFNGLV